ncbi:DUF559 domain-containing protein [Microterricola viridarii]|nr:DUF559 domain-containing protein [Microterricola viridarii]
MPRLVPLPPEFSGRAFSVREARSAGISVARLRSADLVSPFHGVRAAAGTSVPGDSPYESSLMPEPGVLEMCAAYAERMRPGQVFSHLTAARLWGAPLPVPFTAGEPLHISVSAPQRPPQTRGIISHQLPATGLAPIRRFGLPVTDPAASWVTLAAVLAPEELVVVGDHLVLDPQQRDPGDPRPFTSITELAARLELYRGRAKRAALRALARVRVGAESRPETLLRLLLLDAGLPEPLLNHAVRDRLGLLIGRVDMAYPEWRVIVEYDGDQHRTSTRQYERDQTRLDALRRAGWAVIQVRTHGLFVRQDATVARVRSALREAGWPG